MKTVSRKKNEASYSQIFFKLAVGGVPATLPNLFKMISKLKQKHVVFEKKGKYNFRNTNSWHVAQWVSRDMSDAPPQTANLKKMTIVGTKSGWRAEVGRGLDESILQCGRVPLSFKVLISTPYGWNSQQVQKRLAATLIGGFTPACINDTKIPPPYTQSRFEKKKNVS